MNRICKCGITTKEMLTQRCFLLTNSDGKETMLHYACATEEQKKRMLEAASQTKFEQWRKFKNQLGVNHARN